MGAQPKIAFSEKKYAGMKLIMKSLIVCFSYHHNNTLKIAEAMSRILDAQTKTPEEANSDEIQQCDLIGFGSGVDSDKHYQVLLDFADKLPQLRTRKHSFSQLPHWLEKTNSPKIIRHSGKYCNPKAARLLVNFNAKVSTPTVFSDSLGE